mmetsp:Transcript_8365/g.15135  ORF Transcript_8365/g.15135 Transcript_8365/m.15135 type:complete len:326 (-) Transcript_8365:490-1467(-)
MEKENGIQCKHEWGALVWAKVQGFPWTPGVIMMNEAENVYRKEVKSGKSVKYWVGFVHEDAGSWIRDVPSELLPFDSETAMNSNRNTIRKNITAIARAATKATIKLAQLRNTARYEEELMKALAIPQNTRNSTAHVMQNGVVEESEEESDDEPDDVEVKQPSKKMKVGSSHTSLTFDGETNKVDVEYRDDEEFVLSEYKKVVKRSGRASSKDIGRNKTASVTNIPILKERKGRADERENSVALELLKDENRALEEKVESLQNRPVEGDSFRDPTEGLTLAVPTIEVGNGRELTVSGLKEVDEKLNEYKHTLFDDKRFERAMEEVN